MSDSNANANTVMTTGIGIVTDARNRVYSPTRRRWRTALENRSDLASHMSEPRSQMESAGRTGSRQGTVSELTLILPFAPGGAQRLRALLQAQNGNFDDADKVGTVHDMRFVFLDDIEAISSTTAYDGSRCGSRTSTISRRRFSTSCDIAFYRFRRLAPRIHSAKATNDLDRQAPDHSRRLSSSLVRMLTVAGTRPAWAHRQGAGRIRSTRSARRAHC